MTTGVVIVANRSDKIDYPGIALWNARRVREHLGLPVTIITNTDLRAEPGIQVIQAASSTANRRHFVDYESSVLWDNSNRHSVYTATPYDTTILIDADYIVSSPALLALARSSAEFQCFSTSYAVSGEANFASVGKFGALNLPMAWATVLIFKKCELAENIFAAMAMVEANYAHYAELYKFSRLPYRNDYALSIALLLAYGQTTSSKEWAIPWSLPATMPDHAVTQIADAAFEVKWIAQGDRPQRVTVAGTDLHIMGKSYLEAMINA